MLLHMRNTFWDVTDTGGFQNTTDLGGGKRGPWNLMKMKMIIMMVLLVFIYGENYAYYDHFDYDDGSWKCSSLWTLEGEELISLQGHWAPTKALFTIIGISAKLSQSYNINNTDSDCEKMEHI